VILVWRLLSMVGAMVVAFVLPLIALVIVTGLLRTGMPGVIAFGVWAAATVVLVKVVRRLRPRRS
jgi:hypothetical protein